MSKNSLPNDALLAQWLINQPDAFDTPAAQALVAELIGHAQAAKSTSQKHRQHLVWWNAVSQDARDLATRRQIAAYAARVAMRNGMTESRACIWVVQLGTLSCDAFKTACEKSLPNGDRLYVWQWRELSKLHLGDNTTSAIMVRNWLQRDEPWSFDERWFYPLHFVNAAQLPDGVTHDDVCNSLAQPVAA